MRRPASLAASGAPYQGSWSTGAYGYDGAGNIKAIGTSGFTYVRSLGVQRKRL
ncbi:MAG: hypothetical protein ACJ75H_06480 [Thermoanaerobaculia bacterium]